MVRERETGRQAGSSYGAGLGVMHGRVAKAARRDPAPQWINSEDDAENGMVINMAISDDDEGTGEEQAEGTVRPGAAISISYRCLSRYRASCRVAGVNQTKMADRGCWFQGKQEEAGGAALLMD